MSVFGSESTVLTDKRVISRLTAAEGTADGYWVDFAVEGAWRCWDRKTLQPADTTPCRTNYALLRNHSAHYSG